MILLPVNQSFILFSSTSSSIFSQSIIAYTIMLHHRDCLIDFVQVSIILGRHVWNTIYFICSSTLHIQNTIKAEFNHVHIAIWLFDNCSYHDHTLYWWSWLNLWWLTWYQRAPKSSEHSMLLMNSFECIVINVSRISIGVLLTYSSSVNNILLNSKNFMLRELSKCKKSVNHPSLFDLFFV
jgi:hypothetical protein